MLRERLKDAARPIVADAKANTPIGRQSWDRHPGRARASLRITAGGNKVFIAGGKASVPYYGWLDFGGDLRPKGGRHNLIRRHHKDRGRYIYPAIDKNIQRVINAVDDAVTTTLRQGDLL